MRIKLKQGFDQAGLAGPAGGGNDKQISGIFHKKRFFAAVNVVYSMFCTCSRICSINTFMSTEMWVNSSAADLEPKVLASR